MTNIYISPKKIAIFLAVVILGLTAAHIAGQYYKDFVGNDPFLLKIVDKLDLDGESNNLPNWYQSSTLLLSSFLLAIVALIKKAEQDINVRYWTFLSLTFLYLSLDEMVSIHEQLTMPFRSGLDLHGVFFLSWVIPAIVIVGIFALAYLKFLWRLPVQSRRLFIVAGAIYVTGAVGIEMLNGKYLELHEAQIMSATATGQIVFNYALMTAAEEFFEMAGILIFIYALLSYLMPAVARAPVAVVAKKKEKYRVQAIMNEPATAMHLRSK